MACSARARPTAHRIGGGTWDLYLSARLELRSGLPESIEIWDRQLTTWGGQDWGPKKGSFSLLKMSQNGRYPQWYISTPARRSDPPFHMRFTGSPTKTHMYLVPKDLHGPRRGDDPTWVQNLENGKIGRLGRPSRVGSPGDLVALSLDSRPLIPPLVSCPGLWLAVKVAAYCSPWG